MQPGQPFTGFATTEETAARNNATVDSFDMLGKSGQADAPGKVTRQQFLSQFELHRFDLQPQPIMEMKWYLVAGVLTIAALILALQPVADSGDVNAFHFLWLIGTVISVLLANSYPTVIRITDTHMGLRYKLFGACGYHIWRIIPLNNIARIDICKEDSIRACASMSPTTADYRCHNGIVPSGDACQIDLKKKTLLGVNTFLIMPNESLRAFVETLSSCCLRYAPGADASNFPAITPSPLQMSFQPSEYAGVGPSGAEYVSKNFGNTSSSKGRGRGRGRGRLSKGRKSFKDGDYRQENPMK